MAVGHLAAALLVLATLSPAPLSAQSPRGTTAYLFNIFRISVERLLDALQNNVAGPPDARNVQSWKFSPDEGLLRRHKYERLYGARGKKLIAAVGQGERAFAELTSGAARELLI